MTTKRHLFRAALLAAAIATVLAAPAPATAQATADVHDVTFTKDIAPILQRSCQRCHRPESVAPMSLLTYEDARPWARAMKYRTGLRSEPEAMPPWYIEKDIGIQGFKGDLSLTEQEIAKIALVGGQRRPARQPRRLAAAARVHGSERVADRRARPDHLVAEHRGARAPARLVGSHGRGAHRADGGSLRRGDRDEGSQRRRAGLEGHRRGQLRHSPHGAHGAGRRRRAGGRHRGQRRLAGARGGAQRRLLPSGSRDAAAGELEVRVPVHASPFERPPHHRAAGHRLQVPSQGLPAVVRGEADRPLDAVTSTCGGIGPISSSRR